MIKNQYDLLIELTKKEVKVRYKNSYLGYLWSIANPLAMAFVFYFVFKVISKVETDNYALFLLSGLFVWQWISNSMSVGTMLFVGNAGLIKKVNFKRHLLGISLVFSEGIHFIVSIPVFLGFLLYYGGAPSIIWGLLIPIYLFITGLFIYGLALFLGSINLFFRDMERLVMVTTLFIFYGTPVLYPISKVPESFSFIVKCNPFVPFVVMWQDLLLKNDFNGHFFVLASVYSVIMSLVGIYIYSKLKYKFAELV